MKTPEQIHAEVGREIHPNVLYLSTHRAFTVSDIAKIIDEIEAERDKAIELLKHFITHYEVLDYSDAMLDEIEKIAVGLWGVVKERDQLKNDLAKAEVRHAAAMMHTQSIVDENTQLRKVADELASACDDFDPRNGYSSTQFTDALNAYNQLPHVIERNTK
jgi:hypothetical protein